MPRLPPLAKSTGNLKIYLGRKILGRIALRMKIEKGGRTRPPSRYDGDELIP